MEQDCIYTDLFPRYKIIKKIGAGAYSSVWDAIELSTNTRVAVKKETDIFNNSIDCKRLLREIKLLRYLQHPNVVKLIEVLLPTNKKISDFTTIYLILEISDTSLYNIIRSKLFLDPRQVKMIMYNIMIGLHYIHSAGVLHRDLKPANVLINKDSSAKICDFGLSRSIINIKKNCIMEEESEESSSSSSDISSDNEEHKSKDEDKNANTDSKITIEENKLCEQPIIKEETKASINKPLTNKLIEKEGDIINVFDSECLNSPNPDVPSQVSSIIQQNPKEMTKKNHGENNHFSHSTIPPAKCDKKGKGKSYKGQRLSISAASTQDVSLFNNNAEPIEGIDKAGEETKTEYARRLTNHVVTRWYRAPEIILMQEDYGPPIDIWAAGCIFAELLNTIKENTPRQADRKPLFPGTSCLLLSPHKSNGRGSILSVSTTDQLLVIIDVLGYPTKEQLSFVTDSNVLEFI